MFIHTLHQLKSNACLTKAEAKSMILVQIGKQNVQMKADTGAKATVIPYHLSKNYSKANFGKERSTI